MKGLEQGMMYVLALEQTNRQLFTWPSSSVNHHLHQQLKAKCLISDTLHFMYCHRFNTHSNVNFLSVPKHARQIKCILLKWCGHIHIGIFRHLAA